MGRTRTPAAWKTGLLEVAPKVFAYVQATGETGISNSGLIVGDESATAVDALMVPSNVLRCYQEFTNELDRPLDLPAVLDGMERLRGARAHHTCL